MRRELTIEEKELAAAGYEHLEADKAAKAKGTDGKKDLGNVDITEHQLGFEKLALYFGTNIDPAAPNKSVGLSPSEASVRLARDGKNQLTPPKRKSALRKVSSLF